MVQTTFSEKNKKSKKRKSKKIQVKECDFCQNVLLIREYCLSLHRTFNNFHIILNFVFCIHTAVVVRCWRFFFMRACACVREKAKNG